MNRYITAVVLGLASSVALAGSVNVTWDDMKSFRDVRPSNENKQRFHERVQKQLTEHITKLAASLPEGYQLSVQVTDLDLAGDVLPGGINEIRVIKTLYFPAMSLTAKLVAPHGEVLIDENQRIKDMSFMDRMRLTAADSSLVYEKRMLDDWFKDTIESKVQQYAQALPKVASEL